MVKEVKKLSLSRVLADKIRKATALSHETRLKIVLAIFDTEVLKIGHSLTLSQLERLLKIDKHELTYHIKVLMESGLIKKEEVPESDKIKTYYQTTKEGVEILETLGMTEHKIKEISKELAII